MAKLGCICGETMSSSDCPSPNILYIATYKEVKDALSKFPEMLLWDFYTNLYDKNYECWYCTYCKRLYLVESQYLGEMKKVFRPYTDALFQDLNSTKSEEIFLLHDVEIDTITELNPTITISEYFSKEFPERYFIDANESTIYALKENNKLAVVYQEEKVDFINYDDKWKILT